MVELEPGPRAAVLTQAKLLKRGTSALLHVATGLRVGGMTEEVGTGCHLADLSVTDWWRCLAIAAYREEQGAVIGQMQVFYFDRSVEPVDARAR